MISAHDKERILPKENHGRNRNKIAPSVSVIDMPPETCENEDNNQDLVIRWTNLTYLINSRRFNWKRPCHSKQTNDVILKGLSGEIRSGVLMAVMGPSGCGKSTLLHCLTGQRKRGVSGEVYCSKGDKMKAAFIMQEDHLLGQLTVYESLIFASRTKNCLDVNNVRRRESILANINLPEHDSTDTKLTKAKLHHFLAQNILNQLGLTDCAQTSVSQCSGGQRKRLSIASELVSRPDLLILDEPTSGLDSSSCSQCVNLLAKLAKPPIGETTETYQGPPLAIIASIHQPSARILFTFHQLYLLSRDGQCIYRGPSDKLVETLSKVGLKCPNFHNPADYVIEIATGEYGVESIMKLVAAQHRASSQQASEQMRTPSTSGSQADQNGLKPAINACLIGWKKRPAGPSSCLHTWLLLKRTLLITTREPMLTTLRLITFLIVGVTVSLLYGNDIGKADGCRQMYWGSNQETDSLIKTNENISFLFFTLLFHLFTAMMPTVLTFPLEMSVFLKEHNNGWYSCTSYYLAKFLADTPFQLIFPSIYCSISYFMTGQIASQWRFALFTLLCCLISMLSQSIGLLIGAICVHDVNQAVFIAPITAIPVLLFCGFFVRTSIMSKYIKPLSYCSYMKFAFEAMVAVIYGFNRCVSDSGLSSVNRPRYDRSNRRPIFVDRLMQYSAPNVSVDSMVSDDQDASQEWEFINASSPLIFLTRPTIPRFPTPLPSPSFIPSGHERETESPLLAVQRASVISYVMQQFDLSDQVVATNISILIGYTIFLRTLTYLIFLYKARQRL
ncbi:ATP-binding cassette sub-family G member 4-like [Brevipalpus obovatus]|uniref:ATP-binding cassette sub-family G member 4-like n=1 Tax=Brevipalpus obovatus TaxID=246614 RepID=UPI003D9E0098